MWFFFFVGLFDTRLSVTQRYDDSMNGSRNPSSRNASVQCPRLDEPIDRSPLIRRWTGRGRTIGERSVAVQWWEKRVSRETRTVRFGSLERFVDCVRLNRVRYTNNGSIELLIVIDLARFSVGDDKKRKTNKYYPCELSLRLSY